MIYLLIPIPRTYLFKIFYSDNSNLYRSRTILQECSWPDTILGIVATEWRLTTAPYWWNWLKYLMVVTYFDICKLRHFRGLSVSLRWEFGEFPSKKYTTRTIAHFPSEEYTILMYTINYSFIFGNVHFYSFKICNIFMISLV